MLIQKDVKQLRLKVYHSLGLRALLIQKDVKQLIMQVVFKQGLRALLIQKDVKLNFIIRPIARV